MFMQKANKLKRKYDENGREKTTNGYKTVHLRLGSNELTKGYENIYMKWARKKDEQQNTYKQYKS